MMCQMFSRDEVYGVKLEEAAFPPVATVVDIVRKIARGLGLASSMGCNVGGGNMREI